MNLLCGFCLGLPIMYQGPLFSWGRNPLLQSESNTVIKIHFKHPPPTHTQPGPTQVNNVIFKDAALEQVPSSFLLASLPFGNTVFLQ